MPKASQFSNAQRVVLLVCVAVFALGQFHRASGSVFSPILMAQYDWSASTVAGLVSAMFLASIVTQVPFGIALDRTGPRRVLGISMTMTALGTVLFALAQSYDSAVVARGLIGIGLASLGASIHVIVARNFPQQDFGYVNGLVVTLGGIGGLLGTYPLALALERASWAAVFASIAAITLLLTLVIFSAVKPGGSTHPTDTKPAQGTLLSLLKNPEFLKILVLGFVSFAPITTITGLWGGPFLQDVAGLPPESAGAVLLVFFCATILGGYVFGRLDRVLASRRALIFFAIFVSVGSLLALALLTSPPAPVSILLLLVMIFCQQFYIPLSAHMRKTVPDHMMGRASTLFSLIGVAAIPVMQLGFGACLDFAAAQGWPVAHQYRLAFAVMAATLVVCAAVYATARTVNNATE